MPFDKVETQVDFPAQERVILEFWQRTQAFEKLRAKNRGKPKWSFIDGPITANNPMGVHHAWGRTYKDMYQRYFAMTGHELRYQNGFDCQGLWVEVEVEKELELKSKRDIENIVPGNRFASIDRFVQYCKERVDKFARRQTDQSIRLGYWMDLDRGEDWLKPPDQRRSYFTMSDENNYTIWSFLKKCHQRGLVYRGYDAMPWCPRCAVGISQMEMHEGYRLVAHHSVFVRFPLHGRPGENLLCWTTTPWALSSNVGAAINPKLTYLKVKHRDQIYYLAKGAFTTQRLEEQFKRKEWIEGVPKLKTLEQIFKEKGGYEVVGEIAGADMLGWTYDAPFDDTPAKNHPAGYPEAIAEVVLKQQWAPARSAREVHRVFPWDDVGETEGTGIVQIAPGCGREDFQLGKEEKLPPLAPLDEEGVFIEGFGGFTGKLASDPATAEWIIDQLRKDGFLVAEEIYPHSYPHCWRCHSELLFRLVDEWFINMSWREEIMRVCHDVRWVPGFGLQRELDWLKNMGDWMISKKRYWGLALPIWVCESCHDFEVIGGKAELKERAMAGWQEFEGHSPHRPWIDLVKLRCSKCGGQASRIPDVGNPWLDAGIVPYSTLRYNQDRAYWEQWFPGDFITECFPGQFRNWFYALLAMSTMMTGRTPFKLLLGHALVRDQNGEEMHKVKGNSIPFEGAADEGYEIKNKQGVWERHPPMGADLIRWMYCRHSPETNINFGPGPAEEIRSKFTLKLWNTYAFFCNYARLDSFDPHATQVPLQERTDMDRWILSDLQLLIRSARTNYEKFDVEAFCLEAEKFVDARLSNWYVRRNRRRFWKSEQGQDKLAAYQTLYTVLTTLTQLVAPILPFLSEVMYQNLVVQNEPGLLSVHLCDFPEVDEKLIDEDLSEDMHALLRLVSLGSAARNLVKIKVRQPLAELKIQPGDGRDRRAVERFANQIEEELNIKKVTLHDPAEGPLLDYEVKPNLKVMGPKFGSLLKDVQTALAAANPTQLVSTLQSGRTVDFSGPYGPMTIDSTDIIIQFRAPEGWVGTADRAVQLAIDARLNDTLKAEGMAREVVRQVQELRKKAGLEMEDRIVLHLQAAAPVLQQAIGNHQQYIGNETLTTHWSHNPLSGDKHQAQVKIDGQPLTVELRKQAGE